MVQCISHVPLQNVSSNRKRAVSCARLQSDGGRGTDGGGLCAHPGLQRLVPVLLAHLLHRAAEPIVLRKARAQQRVKKRASAVLIAAKERPGSTDGLDEQVAEPRHAGEQG